MSSDNQTNPPRPKFSKQAYQQTLKLLQYLKPYRLSFFFGLIFLSLGSGVFMFFPLAAGELINIALGQSAYGWSLEQMGLLLLGVLVVQGLSSYLRVLLFTQVSEKGLADIRKQLYGRLLYQPITFYEQNRVGELVSRSTSDISQLQDVISITLAEFIRQIILLIGGLVILTWKAWKLALLMLATFPVVILIAMIFGRYIRKLSKHRQEELAKTNTILEETLQAISIVKTFTNEWYERQRYGRAMDDVVRFSMRFASVRGLFIVFIITVLVGAMFFVLWVGAKMVQEGSMKSGDLVTFITLTAVVGGALASLGDFYTQILKAMGASERIIEILEQEPEMPMTDTLPYTQEPALKGNMVWDNIQFNYPARPDVPVLRGLNLNIQAGQKVALVGHSGAGKTTIFQLLLRLHREQKGQIIIDGKPIDEYPLSYLRQNIALVPQDVILFGGSIRENIAYGRQTATEAEIIAAAEQANAWSFIREFPEGLETIVGERGVKLSGGQRQRIAIARAILKNPSILLLDEATSSLDAESEKTVQEALDRLMQDRTAIIIAHRLSTIVQADCIFVLEKGQVQEQGRHEQLLQNPNGLYHQLAKLQLVSN